MTITGTTISLFSVGTFLNVAPTTKTFSFTDLSISDSLIDSQISLFSMNNLGSSQDIRFEFMKLTFDQISFVNTGNLLELNHNLPNALVIRNSTFTNLSSAGIVVGSKSTSSSNILKSKVDFIGCSFDSFSSNSGSFISAYGGAMVKVTESSFTNMETLAEGAVLTAGESSAEVIIVDSTFQNNSAVQGSVFNIESGSKVSCTN